MTEKEMLEVIYEDVVLKRDTDPDPDPDSDTQ